MPAMHRALDDWMERTQTSRRGFLIGAGAVVGGAVLAACSSGSSSSTTTTAGGAASTPAARLTGDLAVAGLAASLENLAVAAYGDVLTAATAGKLGTVPPAVATFATTVKMQHAEHAQAWNSAIMAAGHKAVTETDPVLTPVINKDFSKVTDITGAAKLALQLEDVAAATYLSAINAVKATSAIKVAASIQPVEMQHAAILNYVLGQYPVPQAFAPVALARPTSDLRG
jgi:Ferritin-like domain